MKKRRITMVKEKNTDELKDGELELVTGGKSLPCYVIGGIVTWETCPLPDKGNHPGCKKCALNS